jgi:hypothetical protein
MHKGLASKTEDMNVGDILDCGNRRVVVVENRPEGLGVIWYDPDGIGPHYGVLPHAAIYQQLYENEGLKRDSFWQTHPDFTGQTGEL